MSYTETNPTEVRDNQRRPFLGSFLPSHEGVPLRFPPVDTKIVVVPRITGDVVDNVLQQPGSSQVEDGPANVNQLA